MKFKSTPVRGFKALDDSKGEFEAIVAVFGNVDLGGDRIEKGAFADSLKAWDAKAPLKIPVIFSHMWNDPDAHIGEVLEAKENDEGLYVRARLDMDDPPAAKVFRLMKRGTLAEFSFAYDIVDEKLQYGANELLKLDLIEVGPTLKGMNPATHLMGLKAAIREERAEKKSGQKQAVSGSYEERRELVSAAVRGRYGENDRYWVWVVATFEESAVVAIHGEDGATYREIDYTLKDGTLELGDERDVVLQTTIVPKSRTTQGKRTPPVTKPQEPSTAKGQESRPRTFAARAAFDLLEMGFRDPEPAAR